jgi:hypothetical protein
VIHRALLIVTMLLLPLQWSWSVAASTCQHEADASHFGHHEHKHCSTDNAADPVAADAQPDVSHPDCQTCHGAGAACVGTPREAAMVTSAAVLPRHRLETAPEPPLERLLRPPLSFVA